MSSKKISLTGEVHISTGSVYTTVDALEAMKVIGVAYGLYSHAEECRDQRVMLDEGGTTLPSLCRRMSATTGVPCGRRSAP